MRIIAGKYKNRRLFTPKTDDIRPTSDRAREAIFNLLMHGKYAGENVIGAHVVDLCCGTGAFGLEALSRGAARATFVDNSKRSLDLAQQNVTHCGANADSHFLLADVARLPPATTPAHLVFMDAPYASPLIAPTFVALQAGGWFLPETLFVVEYAQNTPFPTLEGAEMMDNRRYGKACMSIYRVA